MKRIKPWERGDEALVRAGMEADGMHQPDGWPMPVPRVFTKHFTDPDEYIQLLGAGGLRSINPISDGFWARWSRISLDVVGVGRSEASTPIASAGYVPAMHVFVFPARLAGPRLLAGQEVGPGQLISVRPGDVTSSAPLGSEAWPSALVAIPFEALERAGEALLGANHGVALNDDALFACSPAAMARLQRLVADASRIAEDAPWMANMPEVMRALSGATLEALLDCLTEWVELDSRPLRHRDKQLIGYLLDTARDQPERLLSLPEICAALNVSQSTMNRVCQEYLGVSTMRFARSRRMDHVRAALLLGDPNGPGVTELATRYGFWELGRFAAAYNTRFGELPSATLQRTRAGR